MNIELRMTEAVRDCIRAAIKEADGNEIFFTGTIDQTGIVVSVLPAARGNRISVPVHTAFSQDAHVLIHNHPSGNLTPSQADLSVASYASERAQGFYIVDNDVSSVYVVMEPVKPVVIKKIDTDSACLYISSGGPLDTGASYFEERPSQIRLLADICTSFNENLIGVFEAGTGVGKSYAYLIPAILWAAQNHERIVISTGTINLQQQLVEKDIPAALSLTGYSLKTVLLKGRQNYVCLRRLRDAVREPDLFDAETDDMQRISDWAQVTDTGSRSDLSFIPPEYIWNRVCSESDACMGMRCPFRETCFVMKIRKAAADASILVVNHHLLFADIEMRLSGAGYDDTAVLPPYRRIVFDEAHGIESAATSFFSETITRFRIVKQLNILYRMRKNGAAAGHLFTLTALSTDPDHSAEIIASIESVKEILNRLDNAGLELVDMNAAFRLSEKTADAGASVCSLFETLGAALTDCAGLFRGLIESIDEDTRDSPQIWETKAVLRRLEGTAALCKTFADWQEHPDTVFFIEKMKLSGGNTLSGQKWYCRFVQAPLNIAPKMVQGVFEPMDSIICTSATLRTGDNFSFWLNKTGAGFSDEERLLTGLYPSPFPYTSNMLFAVPVDAPLPDNSEFQSYVEHAVYRLLLASAGRALVLFTSFDSLRSAGNAARKMLVDTGITVFCQGDEDRNHLLQKFKNDVSSVLFATDSFWEGVDVPGESLSLVVIVKLPFTVPSDPVFAARTESAEKRGGSGFMELSVPDAVIKFRQGVGRLIRRGSDRGAVVVLDKRLITKRYGRTFLESIPESKQLFESFDTICRAVESFI